MPLVLAQGNDARAVRAAAFCLLIAAAAAYLSFAIVPTNVDVSWLLVACDRLLDGAQLHVDVVEVNPPFSIWLYIPFVIAERATGLPAELWLSLGLPLLALLSVGLCARILGRAAVFESGAAWLAPATLVVIFLIFPGDFGQREQFAVIALLPWLALLAARDRRQDFTAGTAAERIAAGLGAAVFVMIKPPLSVLALALPALFLCVKRRSLQPLFTVESMLGAALTLAYLGWLAAYHGAFFTALFPLLRDLYLPARMPVVDVLLVWPVTLLAEILLVTWLIAWSGGMARETKLLLLAALGYLPAFVLMGKGWTYHALPFVTFGLIGFLVQLSRPGAGSPMPLVAKVGAATGLGLAGLVAIYEHLNAYGTGLNAYQRADLRQAAAAIDSATQHPSAATIATRLQPAHPLTRMVGAEYLSRYASLWMVDNAELLIGAAGADAGKLAHLAMLRDGFIAEAAHAIERDRPQIVFDGGSDATPGQARIHADPSMRRALGGYSVLYRDKVVTVLIRSDLSAGSSPGERADKS